MGASSKRVFVLLVVPVLLMLGSVYAHTVATGLTWEATRLAEEKATAESEGERLEVRITELSESGDIRAQAKEDLGMKDPGAEDFKTYKSVGEDVVDGGGEKKTGEKETG